MIQLSLFERQEKDPVKELSYKVLPVSVVDIKAQKKRKNENHASTSSRANYSPFPVEVADLCLEFYLRDCEDIVDPFAGWGERGYKTKEYKKKYTGFDISPEAIKKANDEFRVENTLADSRTVDIPHFDGMITCPPYWNLEKYANENGLDRLKKWEEFKVDYHHIISRFYDKATCGAVFCILVGDWRKNHKYYDLEYVTSSIFKKIGAIIVDKVVISRKKVSKIKIMLPQAKRLGYSVRVHENLLVFKKSS